MRKRPHPQQEFAVPRRARGRTVASLLALVFTTALMAGCATQVDHHGHLMSDNDLQQIQPGMSQDAVKMALGTPDTTSTLDGQVFYYISSTAEGPAFLKPSETDRRVVAVYFNPLGSVDHVANYGLQDGIVVDSISRKTPSATGEKGFLQKLFRGVGKKKVFDPNAT